MYKVQTVTLTHLMKQKQNVKDETDLKNNFQNISQQYTDSDSKAIIT